MFKTINIVGIAVLFILALFSLVFSQESMTITTYYPSPYGSYQDLTVAGNLRLETSPTSPASDGPQIEWRTGTARHWNIDQFNNRLRFFTEDINNANGAERVTITEAGNVGIGLVNPTYRLQLSIDSAAKPGTNTWTIASDERLKKNIKTLEGALDKMLMLHGVTFEWKKPEKQGNLTGEQMGLIAQEVEKVFPQWVKSNADGYKDLNIGGFEALTAEAIRELKAESDALKARIAVLEEELKVVQ